MAAASEASEAARTGKADIPAKSRIRILRRNVIALDGTGHRWLPNHLGWFLTVGVIIECHILALP
jgi:hypothetical protein